MEAELKRRIDNLQRVLDVSFDQEECRKALELQDHYRSLLRIFQCQQYRSLLRIFQRQQAGRRQA